MQLIWRGWAVDALNDVENASMYINKAVFRLQRLFHFDYQVASTINLF